MCNGANDTLEKIADWDLTENLNENPNDHSTETAVYKQLQKYFSESCMLHENMARISRQLDIIVQDFKSESVQVEQVAAFLKKGAQNQTNDIEKCMSLISNFTDKVSGIYDKSQNILSLAYDMEKTNTTVQEYIGQLLTNQQKNDEAVQDIFDVIKNLMVKTQKIGDITKLINRISSETNLLGLNAKVEAVHAGAYGRGFAVVANEIQRLSGETTAASGNISETIKDVMDEINLLEQVAQKSQVTFKAQSSSVNEVNSAFIKNSDFINTCISEQKKFNTSIEEITRDESILVNAISDIFTSVREVSATAQEISSLTYNQNNSISLLGKLQNDLSKDVATMEWDDQQIKVQKTTRPKRKIAMIFDIDIPFFDPTKREATKAAGIYDLEVSFFAPKSRGTAGAKEMAGILNHLIEERVDALVISPLDDDLIYQKLAKLKSMGVKIIFINSKVGNIDHVSYIQTNGLACGAAAARVVMGVMGNQGEVIVNSWSDTHISAIEDRMNGFVQELRRYTNITVHEVAVKSSPSETEAERIIDSILGKYPNARFIFLTNCEWGIQFGNYMRRHHSPIQVITVDFTREIESAINEGLIHYAIGQRAYSWGSMAIGFIDKSFQNKPVPKYVDTGTYEVNQQNINIYKSILY